MLPSITLLLFAYATSSIKNKKLSVCHKKNITNVFFIHGFQSAPNVWGEIANAIHKKSIGNSTNLHFLDWNAGSSNISDLQHGMFFISELIDRTFIYPNAMHKEWEYALNNINDACSGLVKKINMTIPTDGYALLVGHSMGTEVILKALPYIRNDINITSILIGGISNADDFSDVISKPNIKKIINLYSKNPSSFIELFTGSGDIILSRFLDNMDGYFDEPVGLHEINHEKVYNVPCDCSHSGYFKSNLTINIIIESIQKIITGP
jgi:hypothetical protein